MSTQVASFNDEKLNAFNLHNFSTESKLLSSASTNNTQTHIVDKHNNNNNNNNAPLINSHRSEKSQTHTLKDADSLTNDDEIERVNSMHDFVKMSSIYTKNLNQNNSETHSIPIAKSESSKPENGSRLSHTPSILHQQAASSDNPDNQSNEDDEDEEEDDDDEEEDDDDEDADDDVKVKDDTNINANSDQLSAMLIMDVNFDDVDFKEMPTDSIGKKKMFIRALEYIQHLREPCRIVDDQKCYEAFFYIKSLLSNDERFIQHRNWNFLTKFKLSHILVNVGIFFFDFKGSGIEI
jgi:hypothetical protein